MNELNKVTEHRNRGKLILAIEDPGTAVKLTEDQAQRVGIDLNTKDGTQHLKIQYWGPWSIPVKVKGLAVACIFGKFSRKTHLVIYEGDRTLTRPVQSGYCLDGTISLHGGKYTCFTSSQLFELPGKKLIDVGTIHARIKDKELLHDYFTG